MNGLTQTLIFATFQKGKAKLFDNLVKAVNPTSFILRRGENGNPLAFKNIKSLQEFLRIEGDKNLTDTLLLIDFEIFNQSEEHEVAEVFMLYPELKIKIFMPDCHTKSIFHIPIELFKRCKLIVENLEEFVKVGFTLNSNHMLFDPAGIRNKLKIEMIEKVGFGENNYILKEKSRVDHFALSLDHDQEHSMFVGYALYNFGYSVLPVSSYYELEYLKTQKVEAELICRECDLQFYDLLTKLQDQRGGKKNSNNHVSKFSGAIDIIRGVEVENLHPNRIAKQIRVDLYSKLLKQDSTTWFVTQYQELNDKKAGNKISRGKFQKIKFKNEIIGGNPFYVIPSHSGIEEKNGDFKKYGIIIGSNCHAAFLRGQSKIIKGIYSLLNCPEVNRRYRSSMDIHETNRLRKEREFHDIMAINLHLSRKMLRRAKTLYGKRNYLETAVLATDALELSNGLSMTLALEILSLKIKAETRMELAIVGIGSISSKDIKEKIDEIIINVMRICKNNDEAEKNSLMQYFNSLRKIYHEFEQFEAAETLYNEVLAIETGSSNFRKLKLNKIIKNAIRCDLSETKGLVQLTLAQSMQVVVRIAMSNFNVALGVLLSLVMFTDFWINHPLFPLAYFVLFAGFCMAPKRAIYVIIGAGINFRRFMITFLSSQFVIAFIYMVNLDHHLEAIQNGSYCPVETYLTILRNTIITSLMNQPSTCLNSIMKTQAEMLRWLLTGHIAITVIFLGIFITAIYRWLTRR